MALWKDDNGDDTFDDGLQLKPGEPGFTRDLAEAHFGHTEFSYMGTPNWAPPADPAPPATQPA
jgi:hypothetical protein